MPPRQAPQCSRALRRHVGASHDGIWISDTHLAAVFDRFCAISTRRTRRNVSHVPGPLEARRRLGKRQMAMGSLNLNSIQLPPPPPPVWAFWTSSRPVDLYRWRWQPPGPSSSSSKGRKDEEEEAEQALEASSAGSAGLPGWLGRWLSLPEGTELAAPDSIPHSNRQTVIAQDAVSNKTEVDTFCASVMESTPECLAADFPNICRTLQQYIYLGQIPSAKLPAVAQCLWEALDAKFSDVRVRQNLSLSLYSAIITGVTTSKVLKPITISMDFWDSLLVRLSALPFNDQVWALFHAVTINLPWHYLETISRGILAVLHALFSHWSLAGNSAEVRSTLALRKKLVHASYATGALHKWLVSVKRLNLWDQGKDNRVNPDALAQARKWLVKANQLYHDADRVIREAEHALEARHALEKMDPICEALRFITPKNHDRLFSAAIQLLEQSPVSAETRRRMRYKWLMVLARNPGIPESFFFKVAVDLFDDTAEAGDSLNGIEICHLLLSHWQARKHVPTLEQLRSRCETTCAGQEPKALGALAMAVFPKVGVARIDFPSRTEVKNGSEVLRSFCRFLQKLHRTGDIIPSLRAATTREQRLSRRLLQYLSRSCNDYRIAIGLRDLYMERRGDALPNWDPLIFSKYADDILNDPSLPHDTIWRVLDIPWLQKGSLLRQKHARDYVGQWRRLDRSDEARTLIVKHVAKRVSEFPPPNDQMTPRMAFRHVTQAAAFLRARGGHIDPDVVRAIFRVVTQDLVEGRPGRTSRLRWFLSVVHTNYGRETAIECGRAIQRWRMASWRR